MTVSDFFGFFLGIISLKGVSLFKVRGFIFKFGGWGALALMGRVSKKIMGWREHAPKPPPPTHQHHYGKPYMLRVKAILSQHYKLFSYMSVISKLCFLFELNKMYISGAMYMLLASKPP